MGILRTTAKQCIKRGMMIYRGGKSKYTQIKQTLGDVTHESPTESNHHDSTHSETGTMLRPLVKEVVKAGIMLYDASKKSIKTVKQEIDKGLVEAKSEMNVASDHTLPSVKEVAKPVAKEMIKGGLFIYGRLRDMIQEASKFGKDIVAEAKEELQSKAQTSKQTVASGNKAITKRRKRNAAAAKHSTKSSSKREG